MKISYDRKHSAVSAVHTEMKAQMFLPVLLCEK